MDFPESYKDEKYASLDASTEQKLGLPAGLLSSIRLNGEKSNHSQKSEAQASTVYQIIPATRKAAIDKYGIDPYLSPENASEVAGRLLKDSLDRNKGDAAQAVGEYVGGTDRKNWGRTTNAYINRVMVGQAPIRNETLGNDFAQWMKANPAVPDGRSMDAIAPQAQTEPLAQGDQLSDAFGKFLAGQNKPSLSPEEAAAVGVTGAAAIPRADGTFANPNIKQPETPEPGFADKVLGAGEAGLSTITGLTTGLVGEGLPQRIAKAVQGDPMALIRPSGMVQGFISGMAENVGTGQYGTAAGADLVEKRMNEAAQGATYQPSTPTGQQYTENVGKVLQNTIPLTPMASELGAAAGSVAPAVGAARIGARAAAQDAMKASADQVSSVSGKVRAALGKSVEDAPAGSVDAMKTPDAAVRAARAENMPVPFTGETGLTEGMLTRDFGQQRFERETAKDAGASGLKIRERIANLNENALKNFDAMVDMTGSKATTLRETGAAVDNALRRSYEADKNKVNILYKKAEQAGEMSDPVALDGLVSHIAESEPEAMTAPVLDVAKKAAIKLGVAVEDGNGGLIAKPVDLATAERLRKVINRATDFEPTNVRQSSIMKGLIDESTEGKGGQLYRDARNERKRLAQNYEDRAVVNKLLTTKKGSADRQVVLEDVFNHTILDPSGIDDIRQVRRVLQRGGDDGHQAWRELQGATVNYLKSEATKNVTRDVRGNEVVSPAALDRAVKKLDSEGKLDYIFGKHGAEKIRDLNDIAKDIYTAPPGAVNTSNTASVLAGLFDLATSASTGVPLPVATAVKMIRSNIKDRQLAARVEKALSGGKTTQPKF